MNIEKILDKRIYKEKVHYLVKWAGIDDLLMWVPIEDLEEYPD